MWLWMKGCIRKACSSATWLSIFLRMTNCLSVKSHTHTRTNIILSLYVELGKVDVVSWEEVLCACVSTGASLLPRSRGDETGREEKLKKKTRRGFHCQRSHTWDLQGVSVNVCFTKKEQVWKSPPHTHTLEKKNQTPIVLRKQSCASQY